MILIGIIAGLLTVTSLIFTMISFRRERRLNIVMPLASMLTGTIALPLMAVIAGVPVDWVTGFWIGLAGFFVGLLWGFTVRIRWQGGVAIGRNSMLWLLFFMLTFTWTYALMLFAPAIFASFGVLAGAFPAAMGVGTNLNVFFRLLVRAGA